MTEKIQMANIVIIGYRSAGVVKDMQYQIHDQTGQQAVCIEPEEFFCVNNDLDSQYVVAVHREMDLRERIVHTVNQRGLSKFTFIHRTAVVDSSSTIGAGCYIAPFVIVASNSEIGDDCLICPYCLISHRVTVGQGVLMQPYAMIAGSSSVGNYCRFNVRSVLLDQLHMVDRAELGASSMATKDLLEPGYYLGSPARLRTNSAQ